MFQQDGKCIMLSKVLKQEQFLRHAKIHCLHIVKADTQFAYMYKYMLYIQQKR